MTKTYDLLGGAIALTRNWVGTPAGTCNGTADWQTNVKTQWQVDKAGRVVAELSPRTGGSDSLNLTTASSYDAQGRLVQVVEDSGASANGHLNLTTSYGYDPVGNRLTMTDGRTNATTVTVDPLNRTARVQDASNNLVQTQYSQASEVTATINGRGQTNGVTLDRVGRVLTQNYLKADGVTAGSLSFTYDPGGLLLSFATTDTPTTSVSYDAIRQVQSVSGPSNTSYAYYLDGTVKSVADITGTTSFGEDQLGRLSSTQDPLIGPTATTTYTVDAGSRLTKRVEASGISTALTYSALDQLTQKTMTASGGTSPFASWSNTYDLAGNRLNETSVLPGDTYAGTATFTYDTLQRLQTAAQPTQASLTYGYDAAHNRTSVSGGTAPRGATSFAYLANEALTTETPTGQATLAYSPDADGNITADAAGHHLKYDSLNRLQEVRDGSGATVLASYAYDALGRLTKRTAGTAVTQFFYRGLEDKVVQEQDGSNTVVRSHAWDLNGRRLSVQTGGSLYTVATNPHGDVVGLMTGAGSVGGWTHFDPWGQVLGTSGTTIPFGFQGGFTDPLASFGFVRMGLRWYDPREGRFVSEDPRGAIADVRRPLDENWWDYALDDPVTYLDPLGLYAVHDECGRSCKDEDGAGFADWQPHPLARHLQPAGPLVHPRPIVNPRNGMVVGYVADSSHSFQDPVSQFIGNLAGGAWNEGVGAVVGTISLAGRVATRPQRTVGAAISGFAHGGLREAAGDAFEVAIGETIGDTIALANGLLSLADRVDRMTNPVRMVTEIQRRGLQGFANQYGRDLGASAADALLIFVTKGAGVGGDVAAATRVSDEAALARLEPIRGGAPSPSEGITFPLRQLQAKFKHAADFGISSNWSLFAAARYAQALKEFVDSAGTTKIEGTFHGEPANLYIDPEYGKLLVTDANDVFRTAFGFLRTAKIESIIFRGAA